MFEKIRELFSIMFRRHKESHIVICEEDEDEYPKSYVVNNRKELECLKKSLLKDYDAKKIRHHRIFSGVVKWLFYALIFYLFSDVILDILYRLHVLVHTHNIWDVPRLIDLYFFHDKQGFPNHPLK